MLSCVVGSGIAGFIVSYTGNYWYFLVFAPWLASVGAGLLYTLKVTSPNSHYIGYQVRFSCSGYRQDILAEIFYFQRLSSVLRLVLFCR